MTTANEDWFERIWEHREEIIYPMLFGSEFEGIFPIPHQGEDDPRWSTCGVFRFAPTLVRSSWLYVSSGLSNAWFDESPDPSGLSGFGCEFIMETPHKADWPIVRLHQIMKYQIDLCCGKYPKSEPLDEYHRLPLNSPIDFAHSVLTHLLLAPPTGLPPDFQQESGNAKFILMFGITGDERDFARHNGSDVLLNQLRRDTEFPITNSERVTTMS